MFKKTLLALSVATLAASASAGNIYSSVTDTADTTAFTGGAGTAFGTDGVFGGADNDCLLAASVLKVTATLGAFTNGTPGVAGVSDGNDAITVAPATSDAINASSVTFTANDACTVTIADVKTSTAAKSPIEAPAGTINLTASIVSGIGGYDQEDTITINFTGASIDVAKSTAPSLLRRGGAATDVEILDITANQVRFTVKLAAGVSNTEILDLSGIVLSSTGLSSSSDVKLDVFGTNTSGTKFDVIAPTSVHALVPQYSTKVTRKFNGVINVSDDRKSLVAEATPGTATENAVNEDTLLLDVKLDATTNRVAAEDVTIKVTGDFSWLATAADTSKDTKTATPAEISTYLNGKDIYSTNGGTSFGDATSYALNKDFNELTIVDSTPATAADVQKVYGVKLVVPGAGATNPVLNTQDFTASVIADDTAGTNTSSTNELTAANKVAAGAWTLNGSVVTVPYMPFGPNTKVILRHTNTGVQTGDVTVRYMLEGVSTAWQTVGVVASTTRGVMDIRDLVMNAIMTNAGVTQGKVAIEITSNVPEADVTVYAAYNVKNSADDRGFVGTFGKHGSAK